MVGLLAVCLDLGKFELIPGAQLFGSFSLVETDPSRRLDLRELYNEKNCTFPVRRFGILLAKRTAQVLVKVQSPARV
jgi:hypothetical protein